VDVLPSENGMHYVITPQLLPPPQHTFPYAKRVTASQYLVITTLLWLSNLAPPHFPLSQNNKIIVGLRAPPRPLYFRENSPP
jgi:hypothetical protein